MGRFFPFQPAPDEYPNHLAAPRPEPLRLPAARGLLLILVLLCLAPRMAMFFRIPGVCPDGVVYIHAAEAIEAGDFRVGLRDMSLNTYPVILMLLHRTGLDWHGAAGLWGVAVSSLVVLPLWGWARRQFDDRVALAACLLYAVHPKFIEWTPEIMRDPTFWLFFMAAIYWLWRAVTEVRYSYFIAAGAAITLASLTRIEGLFLLIPLVLWTFWRFRSLQTDRKKLLRGAVLCVVAFPTLLVLVNLAVLCGHSGWAALRLSPLTRAWAGLESAFGGDAETAAGALEKTMTIGQMIWVFIPTLTRGLSPIFALLMFGGIWGWRRVWSRRDHQPLFYVALVVMCGVWVQLWYDHQICPRYALPIVLMASPFAALGLLGLVGRVSRLAERRHWGPRRQATLVTIVVAVLFSVCLIDAMTGSTAYFRSRRTALDVGRWVRRAFPVPAKLVGPVGVTPIIGHYAQCGDCQTFRWDADDATILEMTKQSRPDVVVLQAAKQLTPERCSSLARRLKPLGLEPAHPDVATAEDCDIMVFVRADQIDHVKQHAENPVSQR